MEQKLPFLVYVIGWLNGCKGFLKRLAILLFFAMDSFELLKL